MHSFETLAIDKMRFIFGTVVWCTFGIIAYIIVTTLNTRQPTNLRDAATMSAPISVSDMLNRNRYVAASQGTSRIAC